MFVKIQKPFYFSKINIKTFPKHLVNNNKQLKSKLSKKKKNSYINQNIRSIQCITKKQVQNTIKICNKELRVCLMNITC